MKEGNRSSWTEFVLLGLNNEPKLQIPLFVIFLQIYIITLVANFSIIILSMLSSRLHSPMYFLLSNLSFLDVCYSSTVAPNMLANFLKKDKTISFLGCAAQMFVFAGMAGTEIFLLTAMSYDRYVAICNPLLYGSIITTRVCAYLVAFVYFVGFSNALLQTILTFRLPFCGSNEITHFYCDAPPLLKLSCADTSLNELMLAIMGVSLLGVALVLILISYGYIISAILKISSSEGRWRAFKTCSSHLLCVTFIYGTVAFMYIRPRSSYAMEHDRIVSVFYTMLIPMSNPLIYCLRNKELKEAVKNLMHKRSFW
ncbi:olfactory receptor 5A1-like [Ambystoma mexicanum]|uniref:olfactory receptor 5A1-like n=1 Tax=Ambystoma mexicanum TaxID=8296 RepID=UPI0037E8C39E